MTATPSTTATPPTTAMILAAGYGTRMRPLTDELPKPLVPVLGRPLLAWTLDRLRAAGVERVVVNAHHLADQIEAYAARCEDPSVTVRREPELLDTGGGAVNALDLLGDAPFYVINGDVLWLEGFRPALERLAAVFDPARHDAALLAVATAAARGYRGPGDLHLDGHGDVIWREETEVAPFAFGGVQLLHPRLLAGRVAEPVPITEALRASESVVGVHHDGLWWHVGTPVDRDRAAAELDDLGFRAPDAA